MRECRSTRGILYSLERPTAPDITGNLGPSHRSICAVMCRSFLGSSLHRRAYSKTETDPDGNQGWSVRGGIQSDTDANPDGCRRPNSLSPVLRFPL